MLRKHLVFRYKNLTLALIGVIFAVLLSRQPQFVSELHRFGEWGYLGAFFAGVLFVSTFTAATGALLLLVFAETLHPIELGLIAGAGAVMGDLLILRLIEDDLSGELRQLFNHFDPRHHLSHVLHSRYFGWTLPVLGAIIIASPLPDELGVSLMGISKMKTLNFILISYFLNSLGIFLVVSASLIVKP